MYEDQTDELIKKRMLNAASNDVDISEGSFMYDALSPASMEIAQEYIELDKIIRLAFAKTSSGKYLELRAAEFGIYRNPGTYSTGVVRFTGMDGAIILEGTIVQAAGGLQYSTQSQVVIVNGIADADIKAADVGSIYNVLPGTINQLPIQIVGVLAVSNPNATIGGTSVENDTSLLQRLLIKVQAPSTSGNVNDYRLWALSIPGIGGANIFPLWNGPGTVKVCLIDGNKQPASEALVTAVKNYIESVRPIGATVTYEAAQALNINITVTVIRDHSYTVEQITESVTAKITEYLKSIAFTQNYVSVAQIGNTILDCRGVTDYSSLQVNGSSINISVDGEHVAVLGTVTVNE